MCGILGSVNFNFEETTLSMIKHRGPDDFGIENIRINENRVILSHRRLSIVDLSPAGHQPMMSHCKNFVIIFNGEIYNHLDLKKKLNTAQFEGHSDTETIVNYISEFGITAVKEFNGIFSLAVLDKVNRKVFLCRDRFGVKPLYYFKNDNSIIFSSEIRPIKALVKPDLDLDNLATLLKLRYNPSPSTLYTNIQKLRPGHTLEYDLDTLEGKVYPYISATRIDHTISYSGALENYGILLEQAVQRQLMSDVEIGLFLSGGVDSAIVAHFASKNIRNKIKTFTVGFDEEDSSNEIVDAKQTSQLLGTEHYEVKINSNDFEKVLPSLIKIVEEPIATSSIIPMYFLNDIASKYVKVVLTGQGADEPLGGYYRYKAELIREMLPKCIVRLAKHFPAFTKNERLLRGVASLNEDKVSNRFESIYTIFSTPEVKRLIGIGNSNASEYIEYMYNLLEGDKKRPVEALMSNDLRMNLSDDLLLYTDKISMHYSMEARVPFLDNDLVDFIESLPYEFRVSLRRGKIIHKDFCRKVLPGQIVHRKKKGFQSPTKSWFRGKIGRKYYEQLQTQGTNFSNYFDVKEVKKILDNHIKYGYNLEKQIFILVSLFYWLEEV